MEILSTLSDRPYCSLKEIENRAKELADKEYSMLDEAGKKSHIDYLSYELLKSEYLSAISLIKSQERYISELKRIYHIT